MKRRSPLLLVLLLLCGCSTLSDPQPEEIDLFKNLSIITSVSEDGRLVRKIQGTEMMPESRIHLICENVCANGEKAQMIIPNVRASFKVTELPPSSKEIILENQPEMLTSFTDLSKMEQERLLKELFEAIRSKVWFDRAYHSDKKKALDSIEITHAAFAFVPATRKGQVIVPGQNRLILGLTSHSTFGEEYSYHQVFVFESIYKDQDQWRFVFRSAQNGAPIWSDAEFESILKRSLLDDSKGEPVQNDVIEFDPINFKLYDPFKNE